MTAPLSSSSPMHKTPIFIMQTYSVCFLQYTFLSSKSKADSGNNSEACAPVSRCQQKNALRQPRVTASGQEKYRFFRKRLEAADSDSGYSQWKGIRKIPTEKVRPEAPGKVENRIFSFPKNACAFFYLKAAPKVRGLNPIRSNRKTIKVQEFLKSHSNASEPPGATFPGRHPSDSAVL